MCQPLPLPTNHDFSFRYILFTIININLAWLRHENKVFYTKVRVEYLGGETTPKMLRENSFCSTGELIKFDENLPFNNEVKAVKT